MNDIKDALSTVAGASAPPPLSLDQVRGRARQIRRRRTVTAVVASAAAVAAIAGVGVAVRPSDSHDGRVPPIAKTPTAPVRPTAAGDPDAVGPTYAVSLDVPAEQTFNNEPTVPYWSDGRIVDTDGTATPFPGRPSTFAKDPATGEWVVVRLDEANADLVRVERDGTPVGAPVPTFPDGLALGPRGELVTITQHNSGRVLTEGDGTLDLGSGLEWTGIYGVMPNGDVLFQGAEGGVGVAQLDVGDTGTIPHTGAAVTSLPTGFAAYGMDDGTWRLEDENGATRWTLDWAGVNSFSPDARYVALVGDPQQRIPGSTDWDSEHATSTIWIRTAADLLPVAAFTAPKGGYFDGWTWDGDTLLANVFLDGRWSLVRLAGDGYTVGRGMTVPGRTEQPARVFAAQ